MPLKRALLMSFSSANCRSKGRTSSFLSNTKAKVLSLFSSNRSLDRTIPPEGCSSSLAPLVAVRAPSHHSMLGVLMLVGCSFLVSEVLGAQELQLAPAFKGLGHRNLVGIFDIAAGGDASGDARYLHGRVLQHALNINSRRFTFDSRICGHDQLVNITAFHALRKCRQAQMLGADPVQWRKRSVKNVVDAVVAARLLDGCNIGWFFNNANQALIACGAAAIHAWINVGDIAADRTEMETCFDLTNGVREQLGVFIAGAKDVEGEPLRRLATDAWQLL